jgi:cardiolipin synthase
MNKSEYKKNNLVELINGGNDYFEQLKRLIDQSKESIYIQVYIFSNDETGNSIASSLIKASKRNISVYLLVDGIASKSLSKHFIRKLILAGIHFRFFNPVLNFKQFYPGRRMHQKVIVIDDKTALVGGLNIADKYNDTLNGQAWLDFAVLVIGDIAKDLGYYCRNFWKDTQKVTELNRLSTYYIPIDNLKGQSCEVRVRTNDWIWHKNEVSTSYIELFQSAQKSITILCSYFIPGKVFRRLIKNAAERGVTITVITTGISDVFIAKYAERWLYDWLLRHKIILYEYQKNILHGKISICDSSWLTIGSYNINDISAYASIELNLDIKSDEFVQKTFQKINSIIEKECKQITKEIHCKRKNVIRQFNRWLSYQFIRVVFTMFTFYFKRKA